ncbi:Dynein, axonemal, light intermediate chain 1 [Perkinsus olseni]|uniref:Dynein, axonemal, light intermediate chain 1 n=1 Tax=Perkinsus olseni TaxID=32597 RepID=A0A7J6SEB4_PEROL|nr:Dynein, axonemal, light intermediate chain 1 [Perkinsus olseni]
MATAVLPQECPRESLVRYDPPQDVGEAPEPPVNPEEDELKFLGIEASDPDKAIADAIAAQLTESAELPPMDSKPTTEDVLHILLPPREWAENGRHILQHVNNQPSTRLDVIQLQEALDEKLMERQARETGICPVREELYGQCFDELIRQVTLDCPERGLLLLRIRNEIRMTIAAYQTLYHSSVVFGTRKQIQSEEGKDEAEQKLQELREKRRTLATKLAELERRCEAIERRESERNNIDERKRKEEIDFLKHQGQHLQTFLEGQPNYALPPMPPERCPALRQLTEACVLMDDGGPVLRGLDVVALAKVARGGTPPQTALPEPLPSWVDPDLVRRGQAVFAERGRPLFSAMMVSLMLGSRISRFADVLLHSPGSYCRAPLQTFRRFRDTGAHVLCWLTPESDLFDPQSPARGSLLQVRAMHLAARRRVESLGRCDVGVPVSQYDLAIVLLAFSGMAVDYVKNDFGFDEMSRSDIDAYIQLWRYIGWLLGIADRYNPCGSVGRCSELLADFYLASNLDANRRKANGSGDTLYHTILNSFGVFGIGMGPTVTRAIPYVGLSKAGFAHPSMLPAAVRYLEVYLLIGLLGRKNRTKAAALWSLSRKLGLSSATEPTWFVTFLDTFLLAKGLVVEYLTFPLLALVLGRGPRMLLDGDEERRLQAYDRWREKFSNLILEDRETFTPFVSFRRPKTVLKFFLMLDTSVWIFLIAPPLLLLIYALLRICLSILRL